MYVEAETTKKKYRVGDEYVSQDIDRNKMHLQRWVHRFNKKENWEKFTMVPRRYLKIAAVVNFFVEAMEDPALLAEDRGTTKSQRIGAAMGKANGYIKNKYRFHGRAKTVHEAVQADFDELSTFLNNLREGKIHPNFIEEAIRQLTTNSRIAKEDYEDYVLNLRTTAIHLVLLSRDPELTRENFVKKVNEILNERKGP